MLKPVKTKTARATGGIFAIVASRFCPAGTSEISQPHRGW
jgi:hypothetical protein